jgi:NAD(P)-dependent dehydrogenase (short-subunit alcohol dehydrogenase family)
LKDKVAVVSGVGPGLGREVALALAAEGAVVALAARREEFLNEVRDEINANGSEALVVPTNIADQDQCRRLINEVTKTYGRIDCLVNSAFRPDVFQPFEDVDLTLWRKIFDVNLFGSLQLTQAAIPIMKQGGGGSIIFVNSMIVRRVMARQGGYAASKAALLTAAQVLARELGQYKIRVNSVLPGWLWGPTVKAWFEMTADGGGPSVQEQYDKLAADIALGEVPTVEDVAKVIVFFASDLSKVVTGQSLDANGGEVFA